MSIGIAFKAFFRALGDTDFAAGVSALLSGSQEPGESAPSDSAAQLLAVLQRDGRLVDFLQEDIAGFKDAQVGAVARELHQGCRQALEQYLEILPVLEQSEGEEVSVPEGFDPAEIRLVGKVEGDPPFTGTLRHHGWRLAGSRLPELANASVLVPAEVELQ